MLFTVLSQRWRFQDQSRFEEFMARHAEESQDELQTLKTLNVFYQVRTSPERIQKKSVNFIEK